MARYQSYVICTSPRSGSTLLCRLLAGTGRSGNPDSHFHQPSIAAWLADHELSPAPGWDRRQVLEAIFEAARAYGTGETGMFGLRLQRHSFDFFMAQLDFLHPAMGSDIERFEAAFGKTLFVHLTRADKLDQAISYVKAKQSGLWHRAPDGTELERLSEPREPFYDGERLARQREEMIGLDLAWEDWFAGERLDPLRLTYDALSADPGAELGRVLDALGLDPALAKGIETPVAKLADATSLEWKTRFLAENGGDQT